MPVFGTTKQMLRAILSAARETPGRQVVRSMDGGFTLAVTQQPTGMLYVALERLNTAPAPADWARVLAGWPERVPDGVVARTRKDGRRHALAAGWPRPAEVGEAAT